MTSAQKDTIYIDVDDEITAVIDKVQQSSRKIVALVLPKRAAVFQSIVNMKLLKRSAEEAKKSLVLITSEAGILPLAGAVGLHVAKTLQSKPSIPAAPKMQSSETELDETSAEPELDKTAPIGQLAGETDPEETIELDEPSSDTKPATEKKLPFNKKLRIPNFNKFRLRLFLGILGLILLLVGWYVAAAVLPKANILIKTDTENINAQLKFTSSPSATELDESTGVVPAFTKELKRSEGQKAPATGQKNVGQKATGTARFINCNKNDKLSDTVRTVPAGSAISSGNFTFILSESVQVEPSSFTGDTCQKNKKSQSVNVVAQNPGDTYNLSARDYTVSAFSSMTAEGSDMSGGTNQVVKVVSQQDIDTLRQKIIDEFTNAAKEQLKQQLVDEGYIPLADTLHVDQPVAVNSPNANDEANEVTVNVTQTFTMQGVKEEHIAKLLQEAIKTEIDPARQVILDNGLDEAVFQIDARQPNGDVGYNLQSLVVAGPQLDAEAIKREIAGKKRGETQSILQNRPGVKEIRVDYSPFWVYSTPKKTGKITIHFEQSGQQNNDDNSE